LSEAALAAGLLAERSENGKGSRIFAEGGLQRIGHARASNLGTVHESLFQRAVGELKAAKHAQVMEAALEMVRAEA
jgi:hypothetical protein